MTIETMRITTNSLHAGDGLSTPILGPDSASSHQALGWEMELNLCSDGDYHGSIQAGSIADLLLKLEQLSKTTWRGPDQLDRLTRSPARRASSIAS
jgi:hypothetical protein